MAANTEIVTSGKTLFTTTDTIYLVQGGGSLSVAGCGIAGAVAHGSSDTNRAFIAILDGSARDTVIGAYARLTADIGSQLTNTTVLSGGSVSLASSNINGLTVQDGRVEIRKCTVVDLVLDSIRGYNLLLSCSADRVTLSNGTLQYVTASQVLNTVISSGAKQDVSGGSSAEWTTIADEGWQRVARATARYTVISAGGYQEVIGGGSVVSTTVEAGGSQVVGGHDFEWSGATPSQAVDTTLSGNQQVVAGAIANTTLILSGGAQYIGTGSLDNNTVINAGGFQYVGAGATATGTQINSGGFAFVQGTATGTTINDGSRQQVAGTANGTTVSSGATQSVLLGGTTTATTVDAGGYLDVTNGSVNATTLRGNLQVQTGGIATGTVIMNGGSVYVGADGSTENTVIHTGGVEYVGANGAATGTTISGGFQVVEGTANGTTVNAGRMEIGADGIATGTLLSSGSAHVYAGGAAHHVDFAGASATLYLEDPTGLTGTISNFAVGDTIDFLNTSFVSYQLDLSSLTLVSSGGASYTYAISGAQAGTELSLVSDGHGGTSLSLLSQFSASLVPDSGQDTAVTPVVATATEPALIHAQT